MNSPQEVQNKADFLCLKIKNELSIQYGMTQNVAKAFLANLEFNKGILFIIKDHCSD